MVEGVGGDDGNVQPQCGTSCGTLCHWRTRVCGERVQTAAAIRCSNHVRMPDPSNAIMPLEELRATRHALMEHGPGIVSPRALSVRVGSASAGWIMCISPAHVGPTARARKEQTIVSNNDGGESRSVPAVQTVC